MGQTDYVFSGPDVFSCRKASFVVMLRRMPDEYPVSEFGGKVQTNRIQPLPHVPTPNERMMALYTTGDESAASPPDGGETFSGLRPAATQEERRRAEGVLEKGQVYDQLKQEAELAQQDIASNQAPDV